MSVLTREQLDELLKNKPKGVSDEMVIKKLTERGVEIDGLDLPSQKKMKEARLAEEQKAQEQALASQQRQQRLADIGQETAGTIQSAIEGTGEFAGQTPFQRGVQATASGFTAVPKGALTLAPEPIRTGLEKVGEKIGAGFRKITGAIAETPLFKEIGQLEAQGFISPETTPEFYKLKNNLETAGAGAEIAGTILGARDVSRGVASTVSLTDDVFRATMKGLTPDKPPTVANVTPETIRTTAKLGDPTEYQKGVERMSEAYQNSLMGDKASKTKIEKLARDADVSVEELMKDFVDARGLAGTVDDSGRVSFDNALRDFNARQTNLAQAVDKAMANRTELTQVSSLRQQALSDINARGSILDRDRVVNEMNRRMDGLEKQYPNGIPARDLNRIRIEANKKYKDDWETDANKAIGNATRARIDELDPTLTQANAQWGRLEDLKEIASTLDGRKVDTGILIDSLGSYLGATAIGGAGLATGSGSLVIAGLASTFGQKTLANAIRRRIINNPKNQELIDAVRQDEALVKEILDGIDEANRAQMERLLLPAEGQTTAPIQLPQAGVRSAGTPIERTREGFKQGEIPETTSLKQRVEQSGANYQQISQQVDAKLALAKESDAYTQSTAQSIVDSIPDTYLASAPLKGKDRIIEKAVFEEGGDIEAIRDISRNTIIPMNAKSAEQAVEAMLKRDDVVRHKVQNREDFMGYEGHIFNIKTPNGLIAETQIVSPQMTFGKNPEAFSRAVLGDELFEEIQRKSGLEAGKGHIIYEQFRSLDENSPTYLEDFKRLQKESIDYYDKLSKLTL